MPEISKSRITSPIETFTQPITTRYGSTIGSADTAVGRWGAWAQPTYYDKAFAGYENQADHRYNNQGWINSLGNFAGDLGVKTLSGVPGIIGAVTGTIGGIASMAQGNTFGAGLADDPFLNFTTTMNEWGDEHFPHMLEEDYHNRSFLDQLNPLVSGGQILTSNVSTIGFLAQSFGMAGLIAKAGIGASVASKVGKVKDFRKALTTLEAPNLAKLANTVDDITLNAFLTTNESAMEALETKNTAIDKLRSERIEGKNQYSNEEIDKMAESSMSNVFWSNMATLGATNYFFGKLVAPILRGGKSEAITRANNLAMKAANEGDDLVVNGATKMSKFDKFYKDKGYGPAMLAKTMTTQLVTEGLEESSQFSIQEVNDVNNGYKSFKESFTDYIKDFAMHGADLSNQDRAKAFGLGALMGGGSTAILEFTKHGQLAQAKNYRDSQDEYVKKLNETFTDFQSASLVSKNPEQKGKLFTKEVDGQPPQYFVEEEDKTSEISAKTYQTYMDRYKPAADGTFTIPSSINLDATGAPIKDPKKAADFAASVRYHESLDNLIDIEASKGKPDDIKLELYRLEKLNQLAQLAFTSGTTELLLERLNGYRTMKPEQQQALGFDESLTIDQTVDDLVDHVERLEKNYLSTNNGLLRPTKTSDAAEFDMFKFSALQLGGNIVNLDRLISRVDEKLADTTTRNPALQERLASIKGAFTTNELNDLTRLMSEETTAPIESEVASLIEKKKELVRTREKMGEMYNKYFDHKTGGFKSWKANKKAFELDLSGRKKLFFNDKLTLEDFDNFINGEVTFEAAKEGDKRANSIFYADAINKFIHFLVPEGFTFDAVDSLTKLVSRILSKEVQLYPDEAAKLKSYIERLRQELAEANTELIRKADEIGIAMADLEDTDIDFIPDEAHGLYQEVQEVRKIEKAFQPIIGNLKETYDKLDALTSYNFEVPTKTDLEDRAVNKIMKPFKALAKAANLRDDTIDDNFDQLGRVQESIQSIGFIIKNALEPKVKIDDTYKKHLRAAKQLLADLKKIETLTKANLANRELKEKKENEIYAAGHARVLTKAKITDEQKKALEILSKKAPHLASIVIPHLIGKSKENSEEVIEEVKREAFTILKNLKIFNLPKGEDRGVPVVLTNEEIQAALNSPTKAFNAIWQKIRQKENNLKSANITPLDIYLKTYDIVGLDSKLEEFEGVTETAQLRRLFELHMELLAVDQLKAISSSTYSDVDFTDNLIKSLKDSKDSIVPTPAQIRVIRELSIFFKSKFNERNHILDNVAALKAPAGAGKSLVISKFFKAINGLKSTEILTAAPHKLASENIKTSLSSTHPAASVETLIDLLENGALPSSVRLLVVDEVGALGTETLNKLNAAIAKYNGSNPTKVVKAIYLYDPNQVTPGNIGTAALDMKSFFEVSSVTTEYFSGTETEKQSYRTGQKVSTDLGAGVSFIHNITQISPLSTTYRSDVVEIADLQNAFKSEKTVTQIDTSASSNPLNNALDIQGTFGERGSSIMDVYNKSKQANPQRTRTIIVGNATKKAEYLASMPDAEILEVPEAQGITRDEVYVDVEVGDMGVFGQNPAVFNQYMYTAISRAVHYVQVANAPSPTFGVDTTIPARVKDIKDRQVNIKDAKLETLRAERDLLAEILKEPVKAKPEGKPTVPVKEKEEEESTEEEEEETTKEEEEEVTEVVEEPVDPADPEEEFEGDEEVTPDEAPEEVVPNGGATPINYPNTFHALRRPTSESFDEDQIFPVITDGMELMLVKDISDNKVRYMVLQPSPDGSSYRSVAILEDEEIDDLERTLGVSITDLPGYKLLHDPEASKNGRNGFYSFEPITTYQPVYVGGQFSDIKYIHSDQVTYEFADDVDEDGNLTRLPILERWLMTMYGPDPAKHIANYEDIIKNFHRYTRIVSYTNDNQIAKDFGHLPVKKRPKKVAPYLIIENIELINSPKKRGKAKPLNKQFIRLEPGVLKNTDPIVEPILSVIDKIETLETLLGGIQLPEKYAFLRNGFGIKVDNLNTYYPFHFFVTRLSNAYKASLEGRPYTISMSKSNDNIKTMFPDIEASKIPAEVLKLAYEIDVLVHGDEQGAQREYKGKAQSAVDMIGAQNLVVSTPQGKNVLLRDYRTVRYSKEKGDVSEAAGFSILGPYKFETKKGRSYNPLIKAKLKNRLLKYYTSLSSRGLAESPRAKFIKGILDAGIEAHLTPVTTADLKDLFIGGADRSGAYSQVSNGFGLRRPLNKDLNVKISYRALTSTPIMDVDTSYLQTTFDKVRPTTITISASPTATEASDTPALPKELSALTQLKTEIERGLPITATEEVKEQFTSLMDAETFEEATDEYLKRINNTVTYEFDGQDIYKATRALFTVKPEEQNIMEEILTSLDVTGIGLDRNNTAARDFIRVTVLRRLFPGLPVGLSKRLVLFASEYYNIDNEIDHASFAQGLRQIAYETREDFDTILDRLKKVRDQYIAILDKQGIPHPEMPINSALSAMQFIVMSSHLIRESIRQERIAKSTPAVDLPVTPEQAGKIAKAKENKKETSKKLKEDGIAPETIAKVEEKFDEEIKDLKIEGYESFLREVIEAANGDPEVFTDLINDPANAAYMKQLGAEDEIDAFTKASEVIADIESERSFSYTEDAEIGELLTDAEVSKLLDKIYPSNYTGVIGAIFNSKIPSIAKRFLAFNFLQNAKGQRVWGLYKKGLMHFVRHASGKIGKKVVLHEFFHKAFWEFFTPSEQIHILELAKQRWGNKTTLELEEHLADDFMNYTAKPTPSIFGRIWEMLKRLFGFSRAYLTSIEDYYQGIYNKEFRIHTDTSEVERSMMVNIPNRFDSIDQYLIAKTQIMETYVRLLDKRKGKGEAIKSADEIVNDVFDELRAVRDNPQKSFENQDEQILVKAALDKVFVRETEKVLKEVFFGQNQVYTAALNEWEEKRVSRYEAKLEEIDSAKLREKVDDQTDTEDDRPLDEEELAAQLADIANETFESELRDPKLKITGSVKQRLLSIVYYKNGRKTFGEIDKTYNMLLHKLTSIPTTSLKETLEVITSLFSTYRGNFSRPSIRTATGSFMFKTASNLLKNLDPQSPLRRDVSFRKNANSKGMYAIVSPTGKSTHNVSSEQARLDTKNYEIVRQDPGTTTNTFIEKLTKALPNSTKEDVANAYFFFEDLDFVKSLLVAIGSMRKSNPHTAQQRWNYGKYLTSFYKIKAGGGANSLEAKLVDKFSDYLATVIDDKAFPEDLRIKIESANTKEAQIEAIGNFFTLIKVPFTKKSLLEASEDQLQAIISKFPHVMDRIQAGFAVPITQFDTEEDWKEARKGETLLAEEKDFLFQLVAALNNHYNLTDNGSYTRGDNKKAFLFQDESYQSGLFTAIDRALNHLPYRVFSTFSFNKEGRIVSNDRFLKDNIYSKGLARVNGAIDYDSKKTKGNSKFAKFLRKENLKDFRERHFTFGFLARLRSTKGSSYYQFMPIPSNRTSIQAVDVQVLKTEKSIDESLLSIINAQKNRPDPKSNPDLAANKTYNSTTDLPGQPKVPQYKLWKLAGLDSKVHGSVDKLSASEALKKVKEHVQKQVSDMLNDYQYYDINKSNMVNVSDEDLNSASKTFGLKIHLPFVSSQSSQEEKDKYLKDKNELIKKILPFFYYNFIIQQYSIAQLAYGDETFFKSKEDQTKRIQIATATGDTLLTDNEFGMPERTKVLVVDDLPGYVPKDMEGVLDESVGQKFDTTDGQGYMLPEYYESIASAYGVQSLTDIMVKPVYYSVENGIPQAIKYSSIVLTDEFIEAYPHFESYRIAMRKMGAGQLVHVSAVKVGSPAELGKINPDGSLDIDSISEASLMDINSNLLRFQLNPAKSTDATVRNLSQGTAFMNSNGLNQEEIYELHRNNARVIENGRKKFAREVRITPKGSITGKSEKLIRTKLLSTAEGSEGSADLARLMKFGKDTAERVSLSLPLIADRAISALASIVSDATAGFRFAGSKLVLQADVGTHKIDDGTGKIISRKLEWRDKDGYCEVILPESYKSYIKTGDTFMPGNEKGLVGFRIPSSNYHSLVPLKVVGFYPVPENSKGNVIIAPSLIVYYHGSDYDIDTLFVIRKQAWEDESIDLNEVISKYDDAENGRVHKRSEAFNLEKDRTVVGFSSNGQELVGKLPIQDYLQGVINSLLATTQEAVAQIGDSSTPVVRKKQLQDELALLNKDLEVLSKVVDLAAKNTIVDLFASNMLDMKNRKDLLTPITFARIANIKSSSKGELFDKLTSMEFLTELKDAGLIEIKC